MALDKPSTSVSPDVNVARLSAAIDAIVALQQFVNDGLTQEANARVQVAQSLSDSLTAEGVARSTGLSNLADTIVSSVSAEAQRRIQATADALASALEAVTAEAKARADGDTLLATGLAQEGHDRDAQVQEATGVVASALNDEIAARKAVVAQIQTALVAQRETIIAGGFRPGDSPVRYGFVSSPYALSGTSPNIAAIPSQMLASGDNGSVVRVTGSAIIATLQPTAIEPGRAYRARAVFERRTNPSDPSNDAVQFGIVFLDQGLNVLSGSDGIQIVDLVQDLSTSSGRHEAQITLARSGGDAVQLTVPARARYARAYVRTFGPDGLTDVEVLGLADITDATVLDPVSAAVAARVTTLESADAGPRITALEAAISSPNSVTFRSKSEAAAATIAESVTTVRLLGGTQPGDGGDGLFVRGNGSSAGDTFVSGGVTWARVLMSQSVFNALMFALLPGFFLALPTDPPAKPGAPFNNGGRFLAWAP